LVQLFFLIFTTKLVYYKSEIKHQLAFGWFKPESGRDELEFGGKFEEELKIRFLCAVFFCSFMGSKTNL